VRRAVVWALAAGLTVTGCTAQGSAADREGGSAVGEGQVGAASPTPTGSAPTGTSGDDDADRFERELRRTLTVPPLPAFTVPTDLLSAAASRQISGDLDVPPGLYQGIAVLDARCADTGEASAADAGTAVTGGTRHVETDEVSVTVGADGTGVYDTADLHVAVLADGAGVYDDGRTRTSVAADGSGTYTSGDLRLDVRADGSGSYDDGSLRVWVDPDGAGGYEDETMRLSWRSDGEVFGDGDPARAAAVREVLADGLPLFPPVPRVELVEPRGTVCGTVIRLDADVLFDVDRADVQADGQAYLGRVAALLTALGSPRAQVVGHTDHVGGDADNVALSERRAAAVRDLLVGLGVDGGSLETRGLGETQPLRPETGPDGADDPAARGLNRRVEIVLLDG
jgi:OOP family OmpA-OmpF porin